MIQVDMVELRRFVYNRVYTCGSDDPTPYLMIETAMQATLDFLAPLIRDGEEQAAQVAAQAVASMLKQFVLHFEESM